MRKVDFMNTSRSVRPVPNLPEPATPPKRRRVLKSSKPSKAGGAVIDLDHYVPAYLTWVANKLSRGASQHYLALFDVGIETWRCLVLLAVHGAVTAQFVSRTIGMDKGTVSRCFKLMQERGMIRTELDPSDGRLRLAVLTPEGRAVHDGIREVALERERALLSVLDDGEVENLLSLLRRLHENLPAVEAATQAYVKKHFPEAAARTPRKPARGDEDE
jgi:DNA-binding MarR family transcriptional regulator